MEYIATRSYVKIHRVPRINLPHHAPEIVGIRAFDLGGDDVADAQGPPALEMDGAVDLRRVPLGAALADGAAGFIDDDLQALADAALQQLLRAFARLPG